MRADHVLDRGTGGAAGTQPGAGRRLFTLLELAVSIGLFLVVAATVTLALSASQSAQSAAAQGTALAQAVATELQTVAGESYASLAAGQVTAPNACAGNAAESCVTVDGHAYVIAYALCPSDPASSCTSATGQSVTPASDATPSVYTDVTATVVGGAVPPVTQRVLAPFDAFASTTTGVVVSLSEQSGHTTAPFTSPTEDLYLESAANAQLAVASMSTSSVYLPVPTGDCTTQSPCHLGLAVGSGYDVTTDGTLALSAPSALAPIEVTTGSLDEVSATVFAPKSATVIHLEAQNSGAAASPSAQDLGSVCVWGSFNDGVAARVVPFCNTTTAGVVDVATYAPNAADPSVQFALDPTTPITLSVDDPSGTCPSVGQEVFTASGAWAPGAECTSWTWGVPDGFGALGTVTPTQSGGIDVTPGIDHATGVVTSPIYANGASDELLWSDLPATTANPGDVPGSPAAGYAGEPTWAQPRTADTTGCAADATCTSIVGLVAPEATLCPLAHCLTSALFPPYLIAPANDAVTMQKGTATFALRVGDLSSAAPLTATLTTAPASGTLSEGGTSEALGATLVSGTAPASATLTYTSSTPASAPNDAFQVTLSNGQPADDVVVTISIVNGQVAASLSASPATITVAQGATSPTETLTVDDAAGAPLANATLTLTPVVTAEPAIYDASGLSAPATVTTNASGQATLTVAASSSTPASAKDGNCPCYGLNVATATNASLGVVPIAVTAQPSAVVVSGHAAPASSAPVTARQGAAVPVYASELDAAGATVPSTTLDLALSCTASGYTTCPYQSLVTLSSATCVTSTTACSVTLSVAATTPASSSSVSYALSATDPATGLTASTPVEVLPVVSRVTISAPSPIIAGTGGTVTATVLDGAGNPVVGQSVAFTASSGDLTFSPATSTTNAAGQASVTANAAASPQSVPENVTITATTSNASSRYATYPTTVSASTTTTITEPPPTVTGITPDAGSANGGTVVTVSGTNLSGATAVDFGTVAAASFTVDSSTTITATAPAEAAGTVNVTVTTPFGTSATSAADQFTFGSTPSAPTMTSATVASLTSASLTWSAPTSDGGSPVTGYTVVATDVTTPANGGETCTTTGALSCVVTGLTTGDRYTFAAEAANVYGTGPASAAYPSGGLLIAGPPDAPTGVAAAVASPTSATVDWVAPVDNGAPVTLYTVTATDTTTPANGGETCTASTTSCVVTGLTTGDTYTFAVTATNVEGTGPASSPSSPLFVATAPNAPTITSATTASATSATVTWTAPADNGSPVTGYGVTAYYYGSTTPEGSCSTTGALSCTITGLTTGDRYVFSATATNAYGTSPASSLYPNVAWTAGAALPGTTTVVSPSPGVEFTAAGTTGYASTNDGATWSATGTLPGGVNASSAGVIVTGGNGYVTIADGGAAYYSANDGSAWTALPSSYDAIAYGGGQFLVVDLSTNVCASLTTANFSNYTFAGSTPSYNVTVNGVTSTECYGFDTATYSGGHFYAVVTEGGAYPVVVNSGSAWSADSSLPTISGSYAALGETGGEWVAVATTQPSGQVASGVIVTATSPTGPWTETSASTPWTSLVARDGLVVVGSASTASEVAAAPNFAFQSVASASANAPVYYTATGGLRGANQSLAPPLLIAGVPTAPSGAPSVSVGSSTSLDVTWTANASGDGSSVLDYVATATDTTNAANGGQTCVSWDGCTLTGLTPGDLYTVAVAAENTVGVGPDGPASSALAPSGPPFAPTGVDATVASSTSLDVTWAAPNDGGSPITLYTATATQYDTTTTASCTSSSATTCTITGLTTGDLYTVAVTATNANGTSPASAPYPSAGWATAGSLPTHTTYNPVAYGGGTVVAVDGATSTAVSTNGGATWTAGGALPASQSWTGIIYGNGEFVAYQPGSTTAAVSTNAGATWSSLTLPAAAQAIAYGNGDFVELDDVNGGIHVSTNLSTWTNPTALGTSFTTLAYGGGTFIASGDTSSSTVVYRATNPTGTWTGASMPATGLGALGYGDGVWVALPDGTGAATGAVSTNGGVTWSATTLPVAATYYNVVYENGLFVGSQWSTGSILSADGSTWVGGPTAPVEVYVNGLAASPSPLATGYNTAATATLTPPLLLAVVPPAPAGVTATATSTT